MKQAKAHFLRTVNIVELYDKLREEIGPLTDWWPSSSEYETMMGAILAQNTTWHNASLALQNLRDAKLLEPRALLEYTLDGLDGLIQLIRPAGFMTRKSRAMHGLTQWLMRQDMLNPESLARSIPDLRMRSNLMSISGIGPETADSILLFALRRRTFIADSYTRAFLEYLGYQFRNTYMEAWAALNPVVRDSSLNIDQLQELHGLIVEKAKLLNLSASLER